MRFRKSLVAKLIILIFATFAFCTETVDFFATNSSSQDSNMIKMTTDLFWTQFLTIDGYIVNDRRNEVYNPQEETSNISFYAEIQEDEDGWLCTLNAITANEKKNFSSTKKYSTYYKILLDAKPSIENLLKNITGTIEIPQTANGSMDDLQQTVIDGDIFDTLAGTWTGEDLIEKILILRSGRGFVIFKNGASMNVSVTVNEDSIKIKQNGKSNASFFPEIPRQEALLAATTAAPVEWNMKLYGNTLLGKKTTLIYKKSKSSNVEQGEIDVTWTKR